MPRHYLPMTVALLRRLQETGVVPDEVARPASFPAADDEEAEYAALQAAADESAGLLEGPGRRVVVVAEAPLQEWPVPLARVVAVHADDAEVDPERYDDPPELGWWATQEIPLLLAPEKIGDSG